MDATTLWILFGVLIGAARAVALFGLIGCALGYLAVAIIRRDLETRIHNFEKVQDTRPRAKVQADSMILLVRMRVDRLKRKERILAGICFACFLVLCCAEYTFTPLTK